MQIKILSDTAGRFINCRTFYFDRIAAGLIGKIFKEIFF